MGHDLISKKTRYEFREYLVGWYLAQIEREFDAADISCSMEFVPPVRGQRRSLVEQYYHSVDWTSWADVRKVLKVYESVLLEAADEQTIARLSNWLKKDGFIYEQGTIRPVTDTHLLTNMKSVAVLFNAEYLHQQIQRIEGAVEDDPSLAIGSAKELIETTCKTILTDLGETADADKDVPQLVKATMKCLHLLPEDVPDSSRGSDTIKRILSNLGTVTQGLAELRNIYGTGHGKDGRAKGLQPRHARLAVGAASTLTLFLFETFRELKQKEGGATPKTA